MFRVIGPIGLLLLVVWAITIASVIRTPEHALRSGNQIVWLLVVIFVPFIGVPLYWILGAPQR